MLFADKGAYGRLPSLQPVTWTDDWPMVGVNGKGVSTYKKPNVGKEYPITVFPTNENFRNYQLGMQWGWNHNPDNSKWSLTERPDYLRLKTASVADSLQRAKNSLTQRMVGYPSDLDHSYGTVAMEIKNMLEGDVAGLSVFQHPYAYIGVKVINGQKKLVLYNNNALVDGPAVTDSVVYLRAVASYTTSKASFYYSFDNSTYTKLGSDFSMKYDLSVFTGNKFCLFNYATVQTGGFVDFDWFTTEKDFTEDKYYDNSFVGYSAEALTVTDLVLEKERLNLVTGSTTSLSVKAVYADGHTEDVSIGATYTNPNQDIVQVANGLVIAKADGEANITVSFKGALGDRISKNIQIVSSTFPLVDKLFNPSIFGQGTFSETSHTLITGQWGFGGWWYTNGLNLSGYKYLVARLSADNKSGISFRVFDENSYWSKAAEYNFESNREVVVTLSDMYKAGTTTRLNPSHIYIVGFWSSGNSPIVIDQVFLSNTSGYDPTTSVNAIPDSNLDKTGDVDVYTIMGVRIRSKINWEQATLGLPNGVYIVGRQKVLVTNYK